MMFLFGFRVTYWATNEWAAIGVAPEWLKDVDAMLIKEKVMQIIFALCTLQAQKQMFVRLIVTVLFAHNRQATKERENFGRQWKQRVELMRDVIIAFRNSPSIFCFGRRATIR